MNRLALTLAALVIPLAGCVPAGVRDESPITREPTHRWTRYQVQVIELPLKRIPAACLQLTGKQNLSCARWDPASHSGTVIIPLAEGVGYAIWSCVLVHEVKHIRLGKYHGPEQINRCNL